MKNIVNITGDGVCTKPVCNIGVCVCVCGSSENKLDVD